MADTTNKYNFLDYEGLSLFWNNVKKVIEDNELVTATALTNLDTRVNTVEDALANQIISITYTDLKTRRDNAQLVPGQQYRITDYKCTTTQANTRAVGHQFDIIVTALDEFTLSEEAQAIQNSNDGYFDDSNLSAWKIWYCLDNDTTRFKWADETNGKGVIYRMIDEWNNDIPYDFKNIIYVFKTSFIYNQWGNNYKFIRDTSIDMNIDNVQYYGYVSTNTPSAWSENKCWIKEEQPTINSIIYKRNGSIISYGGSISSVNLDNYEAYTFGGDKDLSRLGICYNNIILPYSNSGKQALNINIFGSNCYNNIFGNECILNTFKSNCYNNTFGDKCSFNTFEESCCNNIFGINCISNTFMQNCYANTFSYNCSYNIFGTVCHENIFGNNCHTNTFEPACTNNIFGNNCCENIFYSSSSGNTFGNNCTLNTFGITCIMNTFRNCCIKNCFGDNCCYNTFGNNCYNIKFTSDNSIESTKYSYYENNHFGDGCMYILLKGIETASSNTKVQNYNFAQGLKGTETVYLTIDGVRNLSYETKIAKNSNGELKIYCEADLIQ